MTTTNRKTPDTGGLKRFKFLFYAPGGHNYWQDTKAGMIAISDDSGPTPDQTDDGTLWLDTTKPIIASGTGFYIPLLVPNSSKSYQRDQRTFSSTCANPQEAKMLIERLNMKVSVDGLELSKVCGYDHSDQPTGDHEGDQAYC
jgi:hypothetical protein